MPRPQPKERTMAVQRSRPGTHNVKTGKRVGPDYPMHEFENPVNADIEHYYNANTDERTLESPNENTVTGAGLPLHKKKYAGYWEGN